MQDQTPLLVSIIIILLFITVSLFAIGFTKNKIIKLLKETITAKDRVIEAYKEQTRIYEEQADDYEYRIGNYQQKIKAFQLLIEDKQ